MSKSFKKTIVRDEEWEDYDEESLTKEARLAARRDRKREKTHSRSEDENLK